MRNNFKHDFLGRWMFLPGPLPQLNKALAEISCKSWQRAVMLAITSVPIAVAGWIGRTCYGAVKVLGNKKGEDR